MPTSDLLHVISCQPEEVLGDDIILVIRPFSQQPIDKFVILNCFSERRLSRARFTSDPKGGALMIG